MPFQKAHSARKMARNWYARANPGIFRNICTSSIFLQHGLFLNSNHKKGLQVSGCGKSLRCFSLQKWITAYICADLCMRGGCSLLNSKTVWQLPVPPKFLQLFLFSHFQTAKWRTASTVQQRQRFGCLPWHRTQKRHKTIRDCPKKDYKDGEWPGWKDVGT